VSGSILGVMPGDGEASAQPGGEIERRAFGHTGHLRSVITLGAIALMSEEQGLASRVVAEALEAGVNAVDVAPTYGDAELKLGEALRGQRDQVFVGCKTGKRDKQGAAEELRESLRRMQTDHFDLYQFHNLSTAEDLDQICAPGGALEAFEEAKQAGLIRFVGLSSHAPAVAREALGRYDFDSVMLPLSFVLHQHEGWGRDLLQEADRRRIGLLAIKVLGARPWQEGETRVCPKCWYRPFTSNRHVSLALRYALAQPITSAIPSGDVRLFQRCVQIARHYRPLDEAEQAELVQIAAGLTPLFTA